MQHRRQFLRRFGRFHHIDGVNGEAVPVGQTEGGGLVAGVEVAYVSEQASEGNQVLQAAAGQGSRRFVSFAGSAEELNCRIVEPGRAGLVEQEADFKFLRVRGDVHDDARVLPLWCEPLAILIEAGADAAAGHVTRVAWGEARPKDTRVECGVAPRVLHLRPHRRAEADPATAVGLG